MHKMNHTDHNFYDQGKQIKNLTRRQEREFGDIQVLRVITVLGIAWLVVVVTQHAFLIQVLGILFLLSLIYQITRDVIYLNK